MYIGDLLNKIRWDKNLKPDEYTLTYFDRIAGKGFDVPFTSIARDGRFIVITKNRHDTHIPLHRITRVKRNSNIIWERP